MLDLFQNYPELLDVSDVADILHCSPKTAAKLCREGKIKAIKIGKGWTVPQTCLKDFILFNLEGKENIPDDKKCVL